MNATQSNTTDDMHWLSTLVGNLHPSVCMCDFFPCLTSTTLLLVNRTRPAPHRCMVSMPKAQMQSCSAYEKQNCGCTSMTTNKFPLYTQLAVSYAQAQNSVVSNSHAQPNVVAKPVFETGLPLHLQTDITGTTRQCWAACCQPTGPQLACVPGNTV